MPIAREWLCKNVSMVTKYTCNIRAVAGSVFCGGLPERYIMGANCHYEPVVCVEAGSNTSTIALRVVRGNKKGTQYLRV
jgi:hypothetical protein